jgi:hypothetical protein
MATTTTSAGPERRRHDFMHKPLDIQQLKEKAATMLPN